MKKKRVGCTFSHLFRSEITLTEKRLRFAALFFDRPEYVKTAFLEDITVVHN